MADEAIVLTGNQIEHGRWLTIRMALWLEIKTGLKRSNRGRSTLALANEITGNTTKSKRSAYDALNKKIVETPELGPSFDKPAPS